MNLSSLDWSLLWPACAAGWLVTATHVPLGMQVLARGIVFIDLAIAQIAGTGVVAAHLAGLEVHGWAAQGCALVAALGGALFLTWTDRRFPELQEAIIGVTFVLAASGVLLLLAGNPHGAEHMKELLVGQILWVTPDRLLWAAAVSALLLPLVAMAHVSERRALFYAVFAVCVTLSVQLVGLYLVFATLIVPALAVRALRRRRILAAYLVAALGYVLGVLASAASDLPTGPTIVWAMAALALAVFGVTHARGSSERHA